MTESARRLSTFDEPEYAQGRPVKRNTNFDKYLIKSLVPDLPPPDSLVPYLAEIDATRWYSNFGPLNDRFEQEAAGLAGVPHAVTAANATLALMLALRVMGLEPGARVLVPAITFPATLLAVEDAGFVPVIADVDRASWELTPQIASQAARTTTVDAVMPVAVFGYALDAEGWAEWAQQSGIPVILDAAAAFGAQTVPYGIVAVFSLHATKPLGIGEGGLFVTHDEEQARRFRALTNFGFDLSRGVIARSGTNAKLAEILAAVGLAQLTRRSEVLSRRVSVFEAYKEAFASLSVPVSMRACGTLPATLMVDAGPHKPAMQSKLADAAIQSKDWYLPALQNHPAFKNSEWVSDLSVSAELEARLIGLPFHGFMSVDDVKRVAETLASVR